MDREQLIAATADHHLVDEHNNLEDDMPLEGFCCYCHQIWPCDASKLRDALKQEILAASEARARQSESDQEYREATEYNGQLERELAEAREERDRLVKEVTRLQEKYEPKNRRRTQ